MHLLGELLDYNDWANDALLAAAEPLGDEQLDRPFDIGPGSLRAILLHTETGEAVWLRRWRGETEAPWVAGAGRSIAQMRARWLMQRSERAAFLARVDGAALTREQVYRDSKGNLFRATLVQMITQGLVHSTHHRAQAVNVLRRLGAGVVELDYMYHVRRAVAG